VRLSNGDMIMVFIVKNTSLQIVKILAEKATLILQKNSHEMVLFM
jgi:hypothetical protein